MYKKCLEFLSHPVPLETVGKLFVRQCLILDVRIWLGRKQQLQQQEELSSCQSQSYVTSDRPNGSFVPTIKICQTKKYILYKKKDGSSISASRSREVRQFNDPTNYLTKKYLNKSIFLLYISAFSCNPFFSRI